PFDHESGTRERTREPETDANQSTVSVPTPPGPSRCYRCAPSAEPRPAEHAGPTRCAAPPPAGTPTRRPAPDGKPHARLHAPPSNAGEPAPTHHTAAHTRPTPHPPTVE